MRLRLAAPVVASFLLVSLGPAAAMPRVPLAAPSAIEAVQNRILPRFFGGEEEQANAGSSAEMRIQQLESQVRALTGQVEQLQRSVRRLELALADGALPPAQSGSGSSSGMGTPPGSLGSLSVDPSTGAADTRGGTSADSGAAQGPIDLSALNQGVTSDPVTSEPVQPAPARQAQEPARNSALDGVRDLQQSGKYSMAEAEARSVLTSNPNGPVAGEARFLLGEALMAQGEYREAANYFLENYTSDPNGARAPASLVRLGAALNGLGEKEAACSSLAELFGAYPNVDGNLRAQAERERQAAGCA